MNELIERKDTFESMNNVIKESKKVMELQPKLQTIFNEVDNYANSYKSLEKENQNLEQENRSFIYILNELFQLLEKFFKKLLLWGNDNTKDETADVVKDCYVNSEFDMEDVIKISKGTTKQDELFDYVEAPDYYKDRVRDYDEDKYDKDNFDLSR